jgi:hypothetical protein
MKRTWQTPKLIVLVRGKPEELVLTGCKMIYSAMATMMASGPGDAAPGCYVETCQNCADYSAT